MKVQDVIDYINLHVPFQFFANEFPQSSKVDNCGVVRVDGGESPDNYVLGFKSPSIQILIRHKQGSEAERLSDEIWNLFHGKSHYKIGSSNVHFSSCDQSEPVYLMRDNNGRMLYSLNVSCKTSG